ncbi:MAG: 3'-5' exonuclease [Bacteroidales bacterium]|nr:3'-5' exonuclease [Bacteroidales bacterium]MCF8389700.1 3'-5' exonuclease [Bacteroidales bacterium]
MEHISPENLLFIDIETVPQSATYEEMDETRKKLWNKKAQFLIKEGESPEKIFQRSGIYAEFGKIICISAGYLHIRDGKPSVRIKSFFGDNEEKILQDFKELLINYRKVREFSLCAHNGKEFDFPYLARRMLIHSISLPAELDIAGKKPWEIKHADTMELWKFGDFKNYTSLELLTHVFDIPTPKDDIDGSMVAHVYYEEKNLERIVRYCEKDVISIIQLMLKFNCRDMIPEENIEIIV